MEIKLIINTEKNITKADIEQAIFALNNGAFDAVCSMGKRLKSSVQSSSMTRPSHLVQKFEKQRLETNGLN